MLPDCAIPRKGENDIHEQRLRQCDYALTNGVLTRLYVYLLPERLKR